MKLSQMTTEQLQAKRVRIDKILADRQADFIEAFKQHHNRLCKLHREAGGRTFRGTFAKFLEHLDAGVYDALEPGCCVYYTLERFGEDEVYREDAVSIFGDKASREDEWKSEKRTVREWILSVEMSHDDKRPLSEAGARALLRVLGKEVTE